MMFTHFFRHHGILGLNARNLLYIRPFNPRKAVAFADDKLKTKAFLSARGIPTAKLYARIENRRQLRSFDFSSLPDEFVLKPNFGFGGEGIIVVKGKKDSSFIASGRTIVDLRTMRDHIEDILDGKFAVNGRNDTAFFEQLLEPDDCFRPLRPAGLPDLRIIVFNLVPVMAMLRLPTAESGGKANVHLGGIGVGIDIGRGVTTHAAQYHGMVTTLPHGQPLAGFHIPSWDEILQICSKIQYTTNIGYLAADITLDRQLGPVLLEVNARAGLMVQVANLAPLRSRLERVAGLRVTTPEQGVMLGKELFGTRARSSAKARNHDGVVGLWETLEFSGEKTTVREPCKIAPDAKISEFSPSLVQELLEHDIIREGDRRDGRVRVKFVLAGRKVQTVVHIGGTESPRATIGHRDLKGFLIDPSRPMPSATSHPHVQAELKSIDRSVCIADKALHLLRRLKPVNLQEERRRLAHDRLYNPVFQYERCDDDLARVRELLSSLPHDESPFGLLLMKKAIEVERKASLLTLRGDRDGFQRMSDALFGTITPELTRSAELFIANERGTIAADEEQTLKARDVAERFRAVLKDFGLHEWSVVITERLVTDCAVGKQTIFLRTGARFSEQRVASLIAHEIETHVLTSENAAVQPYDIFRRGFAGSTDAQEGLAIANQERVLPPGHPKRRRHAENVLAAHVASHGSFAAVRTFLRDDLGYDDTEAISKAINIKRGFTRTEEPGYFGRILCYHRGYNAVQAYRAAGEPENDLYLGKISFDALPVIRTLEGLQPPLILPAHLR